MKALVVYESMFGNTEKIARAVADGLAACDVVVADVATMPSTAGMDLLVLGGPTHAFGLSRLTSRQEATRKGTVRPGAINLGLREYLQKLPKLPGLAAATFDTRVATPIPLGSASHKAHRRLRGLGCRMLAPAESFLVGGTTGPLADGELDRARRWAAELPVRLADQRVG